MWDEKVDPEEEAAAADWVPRKVPPAVQGKFAEYFAKFDRSKRAFDKANFMSEVDKQPDTRRIKKAFFRYKFFLESTAADRQWFNTHGGSELQFEANLSR